MAVKWFLLSSIILLTVDRSSCAVTSQGLKDAAQVLLNNMDTTVDPCNNFYQFACGKFVANNKPASPGDMPGTLANAQQPIYDKMATLLNSIAISNTSNTPKSIQAAAKAYQSCVNSNAQQNRNHTYLLNVMAGYQVQWPIITYNWTPNPGTIFEKIVGELDAYYGTQSLIHSYVDVDYQYPQKTALYTGPPMLALGNRQYYIDPAFGSIRQDYLNTIVSASKLLRDQSGSSNVTDAQINSDAQKILNFEINLARLTRPRGEMRIKRNYINTYDIQSLVFHWPHIQFPEYLGSLLYLHNPDYLNSLGNRIIIQNTGYFDELTGLLIEQYSQRDILNYVFWRFVYNHMNFLPGPMKSMYDNMRRSITGIQSLPPTSTQCIQMVNQYMPFAIGALYDMAVPMGHVQSDISNMLGLIKTTLRNTLPQTPWLDSTSQSNLLTKLSQLNMLLGYPSWMLDPVQLDAHYALQIGGLWNNNYVDLWSVLMNLRVGFMKTYYSQLSYAVDRNNFTASPIALGQPIFQDTWYDEGGTAYDLGRNTLTVPIGEIIAPFYRYDFPPVMNFAGLGTSMSHMLMHGFDDIGTQVDATGKLINILSPAAQRSLFSASQCYISQYSATCYPSLNHTCIDGYKTVRENMAASIGLYNAYHAYKIYSSNSLPQTPLPGLEAYSMDQVFYLQYANSFCSNYGNRAMLNRLKTGVTSPPDASVNNVMKNWPQFAKSFQCPAGSAMTKSPDYQCMLYGSNSSPPTIPAPPSLPPHQKPPAGKGSAWANVGQATRSYLNASVNPCQDFYQFACGGWMAANPLNGTSTQIDIKDTAKSNTLAMIKQGLQQIDPANPIQPKTFKAAKTFFDSCTSYFNSTHQNPSNDLFRTLTSMMNGWPAATPNWAKPDNQTAYRKGWGVVGRLEYHWLIPTIATVSVSTDWKNVSSNAVYIDQGTLGLGDPRFYTDPTFSGRKQQYYNQILQVINMTRTLNNLTMDPALAASDAQAILQFETMLAGSMVSRADREKNVASLYNRYSVLDILNRWPYIDWDDYFNELNIHGVLSSVQPTFIVMEPQYIDTVHGQLMSTPDRTFANYLGWRYLMDNMQFLNPTMNTATPAARNDVQNYCATQLVHLMPFGAARLYVQQLMANNSNVAAIRRDASFMMQGVVAGFSQMLQDSGLDYATKQYGLRKAYSMVQNIGYPDWIMNDAALDVYHYYYSHYFFPISSSQSFFTNLERMKINYLRTLFTLILVPSSRNYFPISPASFGKSIQWWLNSVTLQMALMQAPIYSYGSPHSFHFGSLGVMAGHQMSHGFDPIGTHFGTDGTLVDWLTPAARADFQSESQCLVTQFKNICYPSLRICLPGEQMLYETLSEIAGVRSAFYAYKKYVTFNGAESLVPNLEEFSHDQLFFIKFAQSKCQNISPQTLKDNIALQNSPPKRDRVNAVLKNIPQFSQSFKCQPSDPMAQFQCSVWT